MNVLFNDLGKQWEIIKDDVNPRLDELFKKSNFIGGAPITEFEEHFANYIGTKYSIGTSNGTDALKISLESLGCKSLCGVIIPGNTFIATILAVTYINDIKFDIQLIDCNEYFQIDTQKLEECLKKNRNKWNSCVILPVHLFGHPADIERIIELAERYECTILEDSSQAHGAIVLKKKVGSFGEISAFSLYPGKNLGAAGDAGIITTNNDELYAKCKSLRNYGSSVKYSYDFKGYNHRLDTIQAIIVDEKLKYLDQWNDMRNKVARKYDDQLKDNDNIILPKTASYVDKNVYHIYAVRIKNRDALKKYLNNKGIQTGIHYPIAIQKTKPFQHLGHFENSNALLYADKMLSLPMHPFLTDAEIEYVTSAINNFI